MDVFLQGVILLAVGMAILFAVMALLVLVIMALTRWTQQPARARAGMGMPARGAPGEQEPVGLTATDDELERVEQAAAVAVAIALALAARRVHPTHSWHSAHPEEDLHPWQAYARGQLLDQRKTHQSLRW